MKRTKKPDAPEERQTCRPRRSTKVCISGVIGKSSIRKISPRTKHRRIYVLTSARYACDVSIRYTAAVGTHGLHFASRFIRVSQSTPPEEKYAVSLTRARTTRLRTKVLIFARRFTRNLVCVLCGILLCLRSCVYK